MKVLDMSRLWLYTESTGTESASFLPGAFLLENRRQQKHGRKDEPYGALLQYLGALGEEKHATAGQLSLAWILHRKPYIVPVPGMRSVQRLEENAKALEITLSPEEMEKIDALLDAAAQN